VVEAAFGDPLAGQMPEGARLGNGAMEEHVLHDHLLLPLKLLGGGALVMLESFAGVMCMALVVSRLIDLTHAPRRST
jgi:hypothetical protein